MVPRSYGSLICGVGFVGFGWDHFSLSMLVKLAIIFVNWVNNGFTKPSCLFSDTWFANSKTWFSICFTVELMFHDLISSWIASWNFLSSSDKLFKLRCFKILYTCWTSETNFSIFITSPAILLSAFLFCISSSFLIISSSSWSFSASSSVNRCSFDVSVDVCWCSWNLLSMSVLSCDASIFWWLSSSWLTFSELVLSTCLAVGLSTSGQVSLAWYFCKFKSSWSRPLVTLDFWIAPSLTVSFSFCWLEVSPSFLVVGPAVFPRRASFSIVKASISFCCASLSESSAFIIFSWG